MKEPGKISATIEKTDKIKVILEGDDGEKTKKCLEELVISAKRLGRLYQVNRVFSTKRAL